MKDLFQQALKLGVSNQQFWITIFKLDIDLPNTLYSKKVPFTVINGEYAILQRCHSAVLKIHAISQPIRKCFFASNTINLFATTNTFLQHLVYFSENNQLDIPFTCTW